MEKSKLIPIKAKQLEKEAKKSFDKYSNYTQNPIIAKTLAFFETKKDIKPKDLF